MAPAELLARIERFYDAVARQGSRSERFGGLELFVAQGEPWRYARPVGHPRADDVLAVRSRQRELGLPESIEWMHEANPSLLPIVVACGLQVVQAPLLVLDPAPLAARRLGTEGRVLDPAGASFAHDVALRRAIARIGFGHPGTAIGPVGADGYEQAVVVPTGEDLAGEVRAHQRGSLASALAPADRPVASGLYQRAVDAAEEADIVEVVWVATVPVARRQGWGAAVTATLAREALARGASVVFLSAGSDAIARIYERIGFSRVGTACIAEPPGI